MAFNPNYDSIGKSFTQQYYSLFDNPQTRGQLLGLYHPSDSLMSFEGEQRQGSQKIMEKFNALSFQKIVHSVTSVDCQPMFDGGILINVVGQLKTDDDPPHTFSQTFVLKQAPEGPFFCQHDIFRLGIHSMM